MVKKNKPDLTGWVDVVELRDGILTGKKFVQVSSVLFPSKQELIKAQPNATPAYIEIYLREKPDLVEMNE